MAWLINTHPSSIYRYIERTGPKGLTAELYRVLDSALAHGLSPLKILGAEADDLEAGGRQRALAAIFATVAVRNGCDEEDLVVDRLATHIQALADELQALPRSQRPRAIVDAFKGLGMPADVADRLLSLARSELGQWGETLN